MGDIQARPPTPSVPDRASLFSVASGQGGYFTATQARQRGYSFALLSYHVRSGRFRRIRRGLYRFHEYPESSREHVLAAWLAAGKEAVVSHESALDLLELSDVVPGVVHLTVPRSRRHLPVLPGVRFHTTARGLRGAEKLRREGVVVTSAARSIADAAEAGTAPEQIEMAVVEAVHRGLTTPPQLREVVAERSRRVGGLVEGALKKATG